MARFIPPPGEGRGWMFRWPRQEAIHINDKYGGMIRDFGIKLAQGAGILGILLVGLLLAGFTLWGFPPALWWTIGTVCYFALFLGLPLLVYWWMSASWEGIGRMAVLAALTVLMGAVTFRIFDEFVWDWMDALTVSFFTFRLPVPAQATVVGCIALGLGFGTWILRGKDKPLTALLLVLGLCCMIAWLSTAEWVLPDIKFYVALIGLDAAYAFVAYRTIEVLLHEQGDTYEPYGSETDGEKEVMDEVRYIEQHGGRNVLAPLDAPGSLIRVTGSKGERWVICERNMIHFIRRLQVVGSSKDSWMGQKMPAGLWFLDKLDRPYVKNKKMTRWEHWAPYRDFLLRYNVLSSDGRRMDPMFLDADDRPDPEAILEYLQLNGYVEDTEDGEDAEGEGHAVREPSH